MEEGAEASPTWILAFAQVRAGDLPRVGGKGANLGELLAAGLPVPDGFCVTTASFDRFVAACAEAPALMAEVDACAPADLDAIRRAGAALRAALEATPIPTPIAAAIREHFLGLDRARPGAWAVRSSATLEDLPDASFAGQQDTYLDVRGLDAILDRVRACWASLFTDRAIIYRRQRGFGSGVAKLSVVVQRMVASEVSGILFTADPVSGHRGVISIDASYGLGEALVSGIVDADNYRVDRRSGALLDVRVGAKAVAIVPGEAGPRQVSVDAERRAARALDDAQIAALVELAEAAEAHFGAPQDVEWCIEDGALHLVQARPITTLFPIPTGVDVRGLHVFVSFNHIQVMTDPISPLGIDTVARILPIGRREPGQRADVIASAGGRVFIDATPAMLRRFTRERLPQVMALLDPKMAAMLGEVVAREGFCQAEGRERADLGFVARTLVLPVLSAVIADVLWRDPVAQRAKVEPSLDALVGEWRAAIEAPRDPGETLAVAQRVLGVMLPTMIRSVFHLVIAGMVSWRLLRKLSGGDPRVEELTRGLEGNVTTQMDLELGDLADLARAHPSLREGLLEDVDLLRSPEALARIEGGAALLSGWRAFLERYGHRAIGEIDVGRPRWADEPDSLLRSLVGMLRDPEVGAHRAQHAALARAAEAAGAGLIADARGLRRWLTRRLVARMRMGLALREHPKFTIMRVFAVVRRAVLEVGRGLVEAGVLDAAADVLWLEYAELEAAVAERATDLRERVAERRADYARYASLQVPRVITSEGEIPRPPRARTRELPEGALEGVCASAGVVEGVARVILDPTTEVMHAGEILVAPFTDPGWTPLFVHAKGLVMEVGGLMTHGSVVAREYGIPAVVGVDGATTRIATGQRIRVDADAGVVVIVPDA